MQRTPSTPDSTKNRKVAMIFAAVVVGMVGLAYASVPLYRLFCQVTGFGGTTQRAEAAPSKTVDRRMTILFDANTAGSLPWTFEPVQRSLDVKVGEENFAYYRATNNSDHAITGSAVFNVTPDTTGAYFNKIECFCFTEQTLKPGQTVEMPVSFFIDPAIVDDRGLDKINTITLSYTFYPADEPSNVSSTEKKPSTDTNLN
ncbi:cytochrome c oxidase assembly protein [Taklimakanibacter albus]|uniref:Cytochrome c oxidase assembly protein n=1 Tax=Taklimakanibacter albus TaxID=2800327 RepID=A0ACC5RCY3_9HYPH|nr:cytochrome c oxidase assembly protein [Aestuariivirga sp. YIM B02566]MBK1870468.1 cytochrome c oxidase assembly protein [Aestuariivirga sp. YIM B02566]